MTRRILGLLGVVMFTLCSALIVGPSAQAADLTAAGWWYRSGGSLGPTGIPLPVADPPATEPGELVVEGAPDSANAVAALRFAVADGETAQSLDLVVRPGTEADGESAVMLGCATSNEWAPANGGPFDQKPAETDASRCVVGQRSDDGTSWSFAIGELADQGQINVLLVPGRVDGVPDGVNGSVFSVIFQAPTTASLKTVAPVEPGEAAPPPVLDGPAPTTPAVTPAPVRSTPRSPSSPQVVSPSPAVAAPVESAVSAAAAPALEPQDLAGAVIPEPEVITEKSTALSRVFAGAVLLAGVAASVLGARVDPRLDGDPDRRGLGRFVRSRTGPPPELA